MTINDERLAIIPKPTTLEKADGEFVFGLKTEFGENASEFKYLFDLNFNGDGSGRIKIVIDDNSDKVANNTDLGEDDFVSDAYAYELTIGRDVTVRGTKAGAFYAMITLKQLALLNFDGAVSKIPCCKIVDKPRFKHRGFMMDVARHFFPLSFLYKVVDALSLYKFSVLHLHLSDDQGFRFGSEKFPKLVSIASKRRGTRKDGKPIEGFYTKSELKGLVKYASERGIEIIPEIDMPGHTGAILAAYPELSCTKTEREVREYFGISDNILCAGKSGVYDFVYGLLDEITEVFPSRLIHIGGDEALKDEWKKCPDCKRMMQVYNIGTFKELQSFFLNAVNVYLQKKGRQAVVWNEAVSSGKLGGVVCQYWLAGKDGKGALAYSDGGGKLIVSKCSPFYLDYPHGMHSLKALYEFNPILDGLTTTAVKNVIGVESPLWTEHVETENDAFKKMFPRLFAVAEKGWSNSERNFKDFERRAAANERVLKLLKIEGTTAKDATPPKAKGAIEAIKFGVRAFDKTAFKSFVNMLKIKNDK